MFCFNLTINSLNLNCIEVTWSGQTVIEGTIKVVSSIRGQKTTPTLAKGVVLTKYGFTIVPKKI